MLNVDYIICSHFVQEANKIMFVGEAIYTCSYQTVFSPWGVAVWDETKAITLQNGYEHTELHLGGGEVGGFGILFANMHITITQSFKFTFRPPPTNFLNETLAYTIIMMLLITLYVLTDL